MKSKSISSTGYIFAYFGLKSKYKKCNFCNEILIRKKLPKAMETTKNFRNRKFCNKNCYSKGSYGKNHHAWKGIKNHNGYLVDSKTGKLLHRLIMENYLGRILTSKEAVHHKDGNRSHNTLQNLVTLCRRCHFLIHELTSKDSDCERIDHLLKNGKVPIALRRLIFARSMKCISSPNNNSK